MKRTQLSQMIKQFVQEIIQQETSDTTISSGGGSVPSPEVRKQPVSGVDQYDLQYIYNSIFDLVSKNGGTAGDYKLKIQGQFGQTK